MECQNEQKLIAVVICVAAMVSITIVPIEAANPELILQAD
jgi:hypothetical protein